jgi:DNA replication and repair protein RecF
VAYQKNLSTYKRLILQKNRLLKDGGSQAMVHQMNAQMVPLIRQIQRQRLMYLQDVEQRVQSFFESLNFIQGHVSIEYISHALTYKDDDELLVAMNQNLSKELIIKCTNFGPHRDDFNFLINGKNVRSYFSRGVCRILAYFFQLSQCFLLEEATGLPMLLLLDEPFSEIHPSLKSKLIGLIPSLFYVVYTSTQTDEISCLNKDQIYAINNGTLCKI